MLDDAHMEMFEARLAFAVYDTRVEYGMSIQVKSLADTVRLARQAIAKASDVSGRLRSSAENMTNVFGMVEDMTKQLDDATAELQAAIGENTNGGPPLEDPVLTSVSTPIGPNAVAAAAAAAGAMNQP